MLRRLAAAAAVVAGTGLVAGCGQVPAPPVPTPAASGSEGASGSGGASQGAASPGAAGGETCDYPAAGTPAKPVRPPDPAGVATSGEVSYLLTTTEGPVTITMDRAAAPCTVHSFASLADQGYFDGTRCHRLVDSGIFVLQCGDPTGTGSGGPGYQFANETDGTESYTAGVVAMANAGGSTNGSQFFLVYGDSTSLDARPDYTVFGRMDERSRAVVGRIATEGQDGSNPAGGGVPNNPAEIVRVTRR